eukprot:CAMPEP_0197847102 /NCGR_PEP_ID=MMETSP1438-20131217/5202_1 /TAXON_ID=1461541 /ORGANISM="Pterosperma sp., Strain CCMP1384" /LENGTH=133 /DNA_ID=CAMNT_0043458925 /DNA_START=119 /DNA_END=520 /DNA_ORIENTATION=+
MPFLQAPVDRLRFGVGGVKSDALPAHPVQQLIEKHPTQQKELRKQMAQSLYGSALPISRDIEEQILSRFQRLPGLPSARVGLDNLTGKLDEFGFESYIGLPDNNPEVLVPDMHAAMEARLGMSGAAPTTRLGR